LLTALHHGVSKSDRRKGKIHQVFAPSFDARVCFSENMTQQKLEYIHFNPVRGKWNLAEDYTKYKHSSASYYELGVTGKVEVTHYNDLSG
jgi:hypothetical protein